MNSFHSDQVLHIPTSPRSNSVPRSSGLRQRIHLASVTEVCTFFVTTENLRQLLCIHLLLPTCLIRHQPTNDVTQIHQDKQKNMENASCSSRLASVISAHREQEHLLSDVSFIGELLQKGTRQMVIICENKYLLSVAIISSLLSLLTSVSQQQVLELQYRHLTGLHSSEKNNKN